jgi:hypothetical protein
MSDEKTTNLEPIEEGEASLAEKFGHIEKGNFNAQKESKDETLPTQEKEVVRETVAAERNNSYNKILSKIKKKTGDDNGDVGIISDDAKNASLKTDAESQLQHLVDLAVTKDIAHAVKVARHLEDNYVLDMFHDKLLSDELHDALTEKGLIK